MYANVAVLFLFAIQFFLPLLASCATGHATNLSLTEFIQHLATHSAGDAVRSHLEELQNDCRIIHTLSEVHLRYLIGSLAVSGRADEKALGVDCEVCKALGSKYLPELLAELSENNSISTMARFIAQKIDHRSSNNLFNSILSDLMRKGRSTVEELSREVLAILKDDESRSKDYGLMLSWLPAEKQYELINTGRIPLDMLDSIHPTKKSEFLLREIFFMARYSCDRNPAICSHIASTWSYFNRLMPDRLPPACTSWWKSHSRTLRAADNMIPDCFFRDFQEFGWERALRAAPWKYWLHDETSALEVLGWRIVDGSPYGCYTTQLDHYKAKKYLAALMDGRIPLLEVGCATRYGSFVKLVEIFCECASSMILKFNKPEFFTDEDYMRAIRYFACEKNWDLKLPESWVADNLLEVFDSVKQDVGKMDRILSYSFKRSLDLHCMLLIRGQRGDVPDMLIKQILSVSSWLKALSESESVRACNYYDYIIESGALHEPVVNNCGSAHLLSLVLELILHCKGDHEKMSKLVTSTLALSADDEDDPDLKKFRLKFGQRAYKALMSSDRYPPEEVEFITEVLRECGLLDEHSSSIV